MGSTDRLDMPGTTASVVENDVFFPAEDGGAMDDAFFAVAPMLGFFVDATPSSEVEDDVFFPALSSHAIFFFFLALSSHAIFLSSLDTQQDGSGAQEGCLTKPNAASSPS
jgi:hypothetical protein